MQSQQILIITRRFRAYHFYAAHPDAEAPPTYDGIGSFDWNLLMPFLDGVELDGVEGFDRLPYGCFATNSSHFLNCTGSHTRRTVRPPTVPRRCGTPTRKSFNFSTTTLCGFPRPPLPTSSAIASTWPSRRAAHLFPVGIASLLPAGSSRKGVTSLDCTLLCPCPGRRSCSVPR
ncbi:hypothetical protein BJY59DRAFT_687495 [Rhodotorula toruloides]